MLLRIFILLAIFTCNFPVIAQEGSGESQNLIDRAAIDNAVTVDELRESGPSNSIVGSLPAKPYVVVKRKDKNSNEPKKDQPIRQNSKTVKQLPLQGWQLYMGADMLRTMLDKTQDLPLFQYLATYGQVEPALMGALQGTANIGSNALQSTYNSQILVNTNGMLNPEHGKQDVIELEYCISNKTKTYSGQGAWAKAYHECTGDGNITDEKKLVLAAMNPNANAYKPQNHPGKKTDAEEVSIVRWVINNVQSGSQSNARFFGPSVALMALMSREQLIKNFTDKLGDYIYKAKAEESGGAYPVNSEEYEKLPSEKNVATQKEELFQARRKDLYEILKLYCESKYNGNNDSGSSPDAEESTKLWYNEEILGSAGGENLKKVRRLSLENVPFDALTLDALHFVLMDLAGDPQISNASSQAKCSDISESKADELYESKSADRTEEFFRLADTYAEFVAVGQLIRSWLEAKGICDAAVYSMVATDWSKIKHCYTLIEDAAGTIEIDAMRFQNTQNFREFRKYLYSYRAQQSGKNSKIFTTVARERLGEKEK